MHAINLKLRTNSTFTMSASHEKPLSPSIYMIQELQDGRQVNSPPHATVS